MDIIIIALSRIDHKYSSTSYSLAREFSKNHRVFFVENPFTIKDYILLRNTDYIKNRRGALFLGRNNIRNVENIPENFHQVISPLIIPSTWLPAGWLYDLISSINDRIVYKVIRKVIKNFGLENYIYLNSFNPFFGNYFPSSFKPLLFIYQCVDDISQSAHISKHGLRLENQLVSRADITLTTSLELKRLKSLISGRVHCIPNAADISIFSSVFEKRYPLPTEFSSIQKKTVIYVGNINDRIDFNLCKMLALERIEIGFFFVGPVNTDEHVKNGLADLPNTYFIGVKKMEQLPAYLQHADCAIIPFNCTKLTKSIYPLKINEYLAAGMPVVTTRFSEDIESFGNVVYLADSHSDFLLCVDKAISENSPSLKNKRLEVANANSWSNRALQFYEIVKHYLNKK